MGTRQVSRGSPQSTVAGSIQLRAMKREGSLLAHVGKGQTTLQSEAAHLKGLRVEAPPRPERKAMGVVEYLPPEVNEHIFKHSYRGQTGRRGGCLAALLCNALSMLCGQQGPSGPGFGVCHWMEQEEEDESEGGNLHHTVVSPWNTCSTERLSFAGEASWQVHRGPPLIGTHTCDHLVRTGDPR